MSAFKLSFWFCLTIVSAELVIDTQPKGYDTIAKLLMHFSKENAIYFHFENSTKDVVEDLTKIVKRMSIESPIVLHNYDLEYESRTPVRRQFLHAIMMKDPLRFSDMHNETRFLKDIGLFIHTNGVIDDLIKPDLLDRLHAVFLIRNQDDIIEYFNICAYCGKNDKLQHLVGGPAEDLSLIDPTQKTLDEMFKNFHGHPIKVAYGQSLISFYCYDSKFIPNDNGYDVECSSMRGIEYSMLKALESSMNFTLKLVIGHNESVGMWHKVVLDVNRKWADVGIGSLSFSMEREKLVDFTPAFGENQIDFMCVVHPDRKKQALKLITTFDGFIWLTLLLSIIFGSVILHVVSLFGGNTKSTFGTSVLMFVKPIVEQSINAFTSKSFFSAWLISSLIISTAYKAKLSALMISTGKIPDNLLEDMIHDGYSVYLNNLDSTLMRTALRTSTDPILNTMYTRANSSLTMCERLWAIANTKAVMNDQRNRIQYHLTSVCFDSWDEYPFDRLRVLPLQIFPTGNYWVFPKNRAYIGRFNRNMLMLIESGLIFRWLDDELDNKLQRLTRYMNDQKKSVKKLTMEKFVVSLIAWGFGVILSILCFIGELIYFAFKTKK